MDRVGVSSYQAGKRVPVPPLAGSTITGGRLALNAFPGDVVVINVWASWCAPCRSESPLLARIAAKAGPHVHFVGLDETDGPAAARKFVAAIGSRYPQLSDPDGLLLGKLKLLPTMGIPSTLVIDGQYRMAGRVIGAVTEPGLTQLIAIARTE